MMKCDEEMRIRNGLSGKKRYDMLTKTFYKTLAKVPTVLL